ncbi:hypothetical protein ACH79_26960 [Bradyrhizobium sp. CCBAU 051011]|uniref:trehalose-6-phosphate synthase n=1 Tax=Bradyrhizobium sp. CCBAU 051011 TaxID=858422 RepID=UPI0013741DA5|nr:hypothetical protein ACH79_26960 [Bradyrhizobium sp. CCBAU 051011]
MYRPVSQPEIAALYRASKVGFVTPLRDGMNLAAKEYVAAQDPSDPGALVLSRFAGAADELTDAILVNPYYIDALAESLFAAIELPRTERVLRWRRMMTKLEQNDVHRWRRSYLDALQAACRKNHDSISEVGAAEAHRQR